MAIDLPDTLDAYLTGLWLDVDGYWSWTLVLTSLAMAVPPALVLGVALAPVGLGALALVLMWGGAVFALGRLSALQHVIVDGLRLTAATVVLAPVLVFLPTAYHTGAGGALDLVSRHLLAGAIVLLTATVLAGLAVGQLVLADWVEGLDTDAEGETMPTLAD